MGSIGDATYDELEQLWRRVEARAVGASSLQAYAEHLVDELYSAYEEWIVLARMFGAIELRHLPSLDREFAQDFARDNGLQALDDDTLALSLLATRGIEADWNDRLASRGHLAIPMPSQGFVGEIPMIARLLRETGFTGWESDGSGLVTKSLANLNGVFFVSDARSAVDERERNIIPATDFVERYGVRSVFGVGGSYLSGSTFVTTILFCREVLLRSEAMKFVPLIASFKAATTRFINRSALFKNS